MHSQSKSKLQHQDPKDSPLLQLPITSSITTTTTTNKSSDAASSVEVEQIRAKNEKLQKECNEANRKFKLLEQIHLEAVNEFDKQQSLMCGQLEEMGGQLKREGGARGSQARERVQTDLGDDLARVLMSKEEVITQLERQLKERERTAQQAAERLAEEARRAAEAGAALADERERAAAAERRAEEGRAACDMQVGWQGLGMQIILMYPSI